MRAIQAFLLAITLLAVAGCGGSDSSSATTSISAQSKQIPRVEKAQASDYETLVQELYVAYFGRPADPTGLTNFENALLAADAPTNIQGLVTAYPTSPAVRTLVNSFGTSQESMNLYGSGNTPAFVTAVYNNLLGRPPLAAGLNYWTGAINNGSLSQGDAALAIMAGALANTTPQGLADTQLINNRVSIANYFTAQIAAQNATGYYKGAAAAGSARTMLGAVNYDTDTTAYQSTVNAVIAALITTPASSAQNQATATLNPSVTVLATNEEAQIASSSPTQVTFNGAVNYVPGSVVIGATHAFKVVSVASSGSQTVLTTTEPTLSDLFSSLVIQGTYAAAANTAQPSARVSRSRRSAKTSITVGETFDWDYSIEDGGFALDADFSSSISATVNYNYQANAGGLLAAGLSVTATDQLTLNPSYSAKASSSTEKLLGTITIPINVTAVNSALSALGINLVSIKIPVYAGATVSSSFELSDTATITASGTVYLQYDQKTGSTANSTFSGSLTVGTPNAFPSGAPALATLSEKAGIYIRMAPALAFANTVTLLGVDAKFTVSEAGQLLVSPDLQSFCLSGSDSLSVSADGFFKVVGFSPVKTGTYDATLYQTPPYYAGTCQADVLVKAQVTTPQPSTYRSPVTVSATVALNPQASSTPSAPPGGTVTISAQGASCQATLSTVSPTSASGTCSLTPLTSGDAVPISVAYSGDAHYSPGTGSATANISSPAYTLYGSPVTVVEEEPLGHEFSVPITQIAGPGVEFSTENMVALDGLSIIGASLDVGENYILTSYNTTAVGKVSSFNGEVYTFGNGAPTILGCSIDASSTAVGASVSCTSNQVFVNESGLATTPITTILVNLTLGPPTQ